MRHLKWLVPLIWLLMTAGSGCNRRNTEPAATNTISKIDFIDEAGIHSLTSNRNGKILILNIWATWCPPCVEEFPDLVKLAGILDDKKYEIVGISVDDPEDVNGKVIPFIRKHKVPFKVFIAKIGKQEDFINTLNSSWNGAIPATLIYDPAGNQRSFSIGMKTYKQFIEEIKGVK